MTIGRDTNSILKAALAVLLLAALLFTMVISRPGIGTANAASCANASRAVGNLSTTELRTAVACLLNQERVNTGRHKVIRNRKLTRAAGYHTRDMQRMGFMTHNSSNGENSISRIHNRFGYGQGWRRWKVGEILAECWGHGCTPHKIMRLWLNSPSHSRIIHRSAWMHFGIGARHGTAENPGRSSGAVITVDWGYRHN